MISKEAGWLRKFGQTSERKVEPKRRDCSRSKNVWKKKMWAGLRLGGETHGKCLPPNPWSEFSGQSVVSNAANYSITGTINREGGRQTLLSILPRFSFSPRIIPIVHELEKVS